MLREVKKFPLWETTIRLELSQLLHDPTEYLKFYSLDILLVGVTSQVGQSQHFSSVLCFSVINWGIPLPMEIEYYVVDTLCSRNKLEVMLNNRALTSSASSGPRHPQTDFSTKTNSNYLLFTIITYMLPQYLLSANGASLHPMTSYGNSKIE